MNADQNVEDVPPMEEQDVRTLKPEDFPPKVLDDPLDVDDNGSSKASSAASSDEFVKGD